MRGVASSSAVRHFVGSSGGVGALLAATGLITWTSLSVWGGLQAGDSFRMREAWDLSAYFYVGVPIMALAVAFAAFLRPERNWRWALWLVAGHQLGVLVTGVGMQSGLSLILLTVILGALLATAFAVPAMLGAIAARALEERAY